MVLSDWTMQLVANLTCLIQHDVFDPSFSSTVLAYFGLDESEKGVPLFGASYDALCDKLLEKVLTLVDVNESTSMEALSELFYQCLVKVKEDG